jgi:hypothetical protein
MSWLNEEINNIRKDMKKRRKNHSRLYENSVLFRFMLLIGILLVASSFADDYEVRVSLQCPECQAALHLNCVTFEHEAIEVPGAGWYCNKCDMFQSHGDKCTYCGWPRNKKKPR